MTTHSFLKEPAAALGYSILVNHARFVKSLVHGGPNALVGFSLAVVRAPRSSELVALPVSRQAILLASAHGGILPHHESVGSRQDCGQ
jgi:hypothetical protein